MILPVKIILNQYLKISKNAIPLYFVGIAKNKDHAKEIFDWGWRNNIEIVSWPSFYKKIN